jgi:uncharacterized BrkB/YihY/UPF0761 family membrane protein
MIFACSSVGSVLGRQSELSNSILSYMRPVVPDPGFALLKSTVKDVISTNHIHVLSLCFALWSGSYGSEAIISGLNAVFDVRDFMDPLEQSCAPRLAVFNQRVSARRRRSEFGDSMGSKRRRRPDAFRILTRL